MWNCFSVLWKKCRRRQQPDAYVFFTPPGSPSSADRSSILRSPCVMTPASNLTSDLNSSDSDSPEELSPLGREGGKYVPPTAIDQCHRPRRGWHYFDRQFPNEEWRGVRRDRRDAEQGGCGDGKLEAIRDRIRGDGST